MNTDIAPTSATCTARTDLLACLDRLPASPELDRIRWAAGNVPLDTRVPLLSALDGDCCTAVSVPAGAEFAAAWVPLADVAAVLETPEAGDAYLWMAMGNEPWIVPGEPLTDWVSRHAWLADFIVPGLPEWAC